MKIGLDIGGTKIAGALFGEDRREILHKVIPIPKDYPGLLASCADIVAQLDGQGGKGASIGIGIAGIIDAAKGSVDAANIPYMMGHPFRDDLQKAVDHSVRLANDAACAALAEALDGAGKGHRSVFLLILGTGVGGAQVIDGQMIENTAGMAGEVGHRPLPYREPEDGPAVACACGLAGCIDKSASGPALARLYKHVTGRDIEDAQHVVKSLAKGDDDARRVMDRYYTVLAKAASAILDDFDPGVIVVSGGLMVLPGLYDEVPKRWARYADKPNIKTPFIPAALGPMSGLWGAAMVGVR
ncbi:MAG TPA: ROK family protein [Alphaproteobacteria bacterium]|nr:ROK family protein [Alphaproteobacteria bacterium]